MYFSTFEVRRMNVQMVCCTWKFVQLNIVTISLHKQCTQILSITPINRMMSTSNITFIDDIELTKFVSGPFVPSCKVEELHGRFLSMVTSTDHIVDAAYTLDDQEEIAIPHKKTQRMG